jgi:hypothetical protein
VNNETRNKQTRGLVSLARGWNGGTHSASPLPWEIQRRPSPRLPPLSYNPVIHPFPRLLDVDFQRIGWEGRSTLEATRISTNASSEIRKSEENKRENEE